MYDGYEIKIREEGTDEILRALAVRHSCLGNPGSPRDVATEEHLGLVYNSTLIYDVEGDEDVALAQVAVDAEKALLNAGNAYFKEGYRFRQTRRSMDGISIDVPEDAIAWVAVSAGHIATSSAFRIEYLTKIILLSH